MGEDEIMPATPLAPEREDSSDSGITLVGRNSTTLPEAYAEHDERQQSGDSEKKLEAPFEYRSSQQFDEHDFDATYDLEKPARQDSPGLRTPEIRFGLEQQDDQQYDYGKQHTPRDFGRVSYLDTPTNMSRTDLNRMTPHTTLSPSNYATPRTTRPHPTPYPSARPPLSTTTTMTKASTRTLPALKREETRMMQKEAHPWEHLGITLGLPAIVLFDVIVPIIIYYSWYNASAEHRRKQFDKDIMGYTVITFGFGELWILLARVWRLFFRHEHCAPLLSRSKYELDATCWVYLTAMIVALIPFVVGSSLTMPHVYLYGPSCLMGFLGLLMIATLVPFKLPIGINSQPRGTTIRPFIYYAAEDFIAVDGLQDREFRERYNDRYERNRAFRRMFLYLTLWWLTGVFTFVGCVSAVIWTCEFHHAFGASLGVLFGYIAIWAGVSAVYVKWEVAREHRLFEAEMAAA